MRKGIAESFLERGAKIFGRAAGTVLSDPRGQEVVARAVGLAQRGFRLFETAQHRALHAAGLAARPDYDDVRKQVARLKRKTRELSDRLDRSLAVEHAAADDGDDGDDGDDERRSR